MEIIRLISLAFPEKAVKQKCISYISLLIIPCMIVYVTNKQEPKLLKYSSVVVQRRRASNLSSQIVVSQCHMHDNTWEFHPLLMDNGHMTMEGIVSSTISLYSFETTPFTIKALTTPAPNQNASRALTGVCGFGVRIRGLRCWTTTPFPGILSK